MMFTVTLLCTVCAAGPVPRLAPQGRTSPFIPLNGAMPMAINHDADNAVLVLMNHEGDVLSGPHQVEQGKVVDLLVLMPVIRSLDEAAYVQLMHGEQPINCPWVIEPALSRRIPIVQEVESPERGAWTKIVGWQDEGALDNDELPDGAGRIEGAALSSAAPRDDAVIRSGWWVYLERDVHMLTDHGEFRIDMREDAAPSTCRNFRALASMGFYNNTIAHRIIPKGRNGRPFVIQGGDPLGTGEGGPGWWLPLEPTHLGHDYGVMSMARGQNPDSAGSQWFIALDREETARLDGQYCAFGEIFMGKDAIDSMAAVELGDTDYLSSRPVQPPRITVARLAPAPTRTPGKGRMHQRVLPTNRR
jgi:peptidyl-prolyl cis-trans isomerase B (cyclophilin B)